MGIVGPSAPEKWRHVYTGAGETPVTCDRGLSGRLESKSMLLKKQMCAPDFPKSMVLISVIIPAAENSQVQQYWYKYTRSLVLIATSGLVGTLLVVYLKPYYTMPARVYSNVYCFRTCYYTVPGTR